MVIKIHLIIVWNKSFIHFLITKENVFLIFKRGFIKVIVDFTLDNIEDRELCEKSSFILFVTFRSLEEFYQIEEFFHEIKRFELIYELIFTYPLDEKICLNTLNTLFFIFGCSDYINFTEEDLNPLFESGIFDAIFSIEEKSKNDYIVLMCYSTFESISEKGKFFFFSFFNQLFVFNI